MNLKNKYIAVIGAGESGVGAALLAQKYLFLIMGLSKKIIKKSLKKMPFLSKKRGIVLLKLKARMK